MLDEKWEKYLKLHDRCYLFFCLVTAGQRWSFKEVGGALWKQAFKPPQMVASGDSSISHNMFTE